MENCCHRVDIFCNYNLTTCAYPLGYSERGILQARILEWVAIPFSRVHFPYRQFYLSNSVERVSCIAGRFFTIWVTREAQPVLTDISNSQDLVGYQWQLPSGKVLGRIFQK